MKEPVYFFSNYNQLNFVVGPTEMLEMEDNEKGKMKQ